MDHNTEPNIDPNTSIYTGIEALKKSGLTPSFIEALQASMLPGTLKILRSGGIPAYNRPVSTKTSINKTKTTGFGLGAPFIAADPKFSRWVKNPHVPNGRKLGIHKKDLALLLEGIQKTIVLKMTLREMLEVKDVEIENYEPSSKRLIFLLKKGAYANPAESIRYHIDLSAGNILANKRKYLRPWDRIPDESCPSILKEFDLDNEEYEVYSSINNCKPKPYKIFASPHDAQGNLEPTTSDIDSFLTVPPRWLAHNKEFSYALVEYKTFDSNGYPVINEIEGLIKNSVRWYEELKTRALAKNNYLNKAEQYLRDPNNSALSCLDNEFSLEHSGNIRPFDYVQNQITNKIFNNENVNNLFQHGDEAFSPFPPEDINKPFVIIQKDIDGADKFPVYVNNATELVNYIIHNSYLKDYIIQITPNLSMEYFFPIIQEQQKLGLSNDILPETLEAYKAYIELQPIEKN
jgi:hypothetical protein